MNSTEVSDAATLACISAAFIFLNKNVKKKTQKIPAIDMGYYTKFMG
jgi:hypothetical protein